MPALTLPDGVVLHYEDDRAENPDTPAVVLVHGVAEDSRAWAAWVPQLARDYRLIRPDLPGFGASHVPPNFPRSWSVEALAEDLRHLLDALGLGRVHIVGAKYGGSIAARFAIDHPKRLATLSVVGGPIAMKDRTRGIDLTSYSADIEQLGVKGWAAKSMRNRLGSATSDAELTGWTDFMGAADLRATAACSRAAGALDLAGDLEQLRVPSLFVTTRGSPLLPVDDYAAVIERLPSSRLEILETDGYHPAVTHADEVVRLVRRHLAG